MATQQMLRGNWDIIKGRLQQTWGQLTDDDLRTFAGDTNELVGLIERRTGQSRERIQEQLNGILANISGGSQQSAQQVGETARRYMDQAGETMRGATEQLRQRYAGAESMVQQKPGQSIAVAFGAGMFMGLIVGMMMRGGR